jgi:hypothetical protein
MQQVIIIEIQVPLTKRELFLQYTLTVPIN